METVGRTGVEMEALTAVAVGLLTIYDMCKAVDRGMRCERIRLLEKKGGKSGTGGPRGAVIAAVALDVGRHSVDIPRDRGSFRSRVDSAGNLG